MAADAGKGRRSQDTAPHAPGMARALLAVLAIVATAAVLVVLVYAVMVAIRPIETRSPKKAEAVDHLPGVVGSREYAPTAQHGNGRRPSPLPHAGAAMRVHAPRLAPVWIELG